MFCHHCGTEIPAGVQFCPNCGQPVSAAASLESGGPLSWTPRSGAQSHTGRWIGEGWRLVKDDLGNYVLLAVVFTVLNAAVPLILQGPLIAGFHIFTMKKLTSRRAEFADLFTGFNFFVPTLVASLVIALFTFAGTLLCLIPGLIVAAMYKFTYLFIVDKKMDFWPAMQASHAIVKQDYFGFTMFLVALAGINILGALCCIIGIFVSLPVTFVAITLAYREIVGFDEQTIAAL
jgi:uncharacterized membrane protein